MEQIVQPFGNGEEGWVGINHQPPGVYAGTPSVRHKRLQHLGHAAALSSGTDVPDRTTVEQATCGSSHGVQPRDPARRQHLTQAGQRYGADHHLMHGFIVPQRPLRRWGSATTHRQ